MLGKKLFGKVVKIRDRPYLTKLWASKNIVKCDKWCEGV